MSSATITVIPSDGDLGLIELSEYIEKPCLPCGVPDTFVTAIAAQEKGENYLTPSQRRAIETEILSSDVPGNKGLNAKKIGDIWLCRMLVNTWAILFTQRAFQRPFKAIPWQLRMHGFGV